MKHRLSYFNCLFLLCCTLNFVIFRQNKIYLLIFITCLCLLYQVEDISREPQVERELMLIKLNADPSTRAEVMIQIIQLIS